MPICALAHETDWTGWRHAARAFVLAGVPPAELTWNVGGTGAAAPKTDGGFTLSRSLVALVSLAFQAREPERFGLLYTLIWRAHHGDLVLTDSGDADLRTAQRWALAARADAHRMRALVRFAPVPSSGARMPGLPHFLGWYEPDHLVLEANARLLARRDPSRGFTIVTPDGIAHRDQAGLRFGAGLTNPGDDETLLAWWDAHQDTILVAAHDGGGLPEAEELDEVPRPLDRPALGPVVRPGSQTAATRNIARDARPCARCGLAGPATQTVFGEGPRDSRVMFIGEQPGDQEDIIGRPFVGPAGQLLDAALEEAGIDRRRIYITNAVKHFKFTPRGRRRIHQPPAPDEIEICRFWLDAERTTVNPGLIVLLGGSAGRAVLGRPVAVTRERGRPFTLPDGGMALLTVHPSYLLRQPDDTARAREYAAFLRDLLTVRDLISSWSE